ncbi:MAG: hypothetical protein KAH22_10965 [Thiotrichaceae bacterium]|nr:hypothetical protein [Thiotrichaceae bacterium]
MFELFSTWFSQGFYHPLQTPQQLLLILSLAILVAQQGQTIQASFSFFLAIIVGFIFNHYLNLDINTELILLCLALSTSLLCLIKLSLNSILLGIIVFSCGLLIGYDSSPISIPGLGDKITIQWLSGAGTSMVLSFVLIASFCLLLKPFWQGLILRILSSWLATSALIVLTLQLATK